MKKVFVVVEHYGDYEDAYSHVFAVCETIEGANLKKVDSEESHKTSITREEWDAYCEEVNTWEREHDEEEGFESWTEGIAYLHPELDFDVLNHAEMCHCEDNYVFTEIVEAPFFGE